MVLTFDIEDLVSFGNYLLSEERKNRKHNEDCVTDADISNWIGTNENILNLN